MEHLPLHLLHPPHMKPNPADTPTPTVSPRDIGSLSTEVKVGLKAAMLYTSDVQKTNKERLRYKDAYREFLCKTV